jgi:3-oxoacyl-[acyl-carrier protein] reductase
MNSLNNKVALVTGGARDIGKAVSVLLAAEGASVAINYFDNPEDAHETVGIITAAGGRAVAFQGDVTSPSDVQRLVEQTASSGRSHILVNVAGGLVGRKRMER